MQIVVRNAPEGLRIRHAGSVYTHYPVENLGAFECSDETLNRLWEIGRYTALQCTHDAWEDCPGREKRQWLGDGIVHYLIGAAAFGPSTQAIDRQFLIHGMESQCPDGLLQMFSPGDNHRNGIVIPDFCLHWICAAHHYFMHTGDLQQAGGVYATVRGPIKVAWEIDGHVLDLQIDLPQEVTAIVVAPPGYRQQQGETDIGPDSHRIQFQKQQ